jgi:hypothetical protein
VFSAFFLAVGKSLQLALCLVDDALVSLCRIARKRDDLQCRGRDAEESSSSEVRIENQSNCTANRRGNQHLASLPLQAMSVFVTACGNKPYYRIDSETAARKNVSNAYLNTVRAAEDGRVERGLVDVARYDEPNVWVVESGAAVSQQIDVSSQGALERGVPGELVMKFGCERKGVGGGDHSLQHTPNARRRIACLLLSCELQLLSAANAGGKLQAVHACMSLIQSAI